MKEAWTQFLKLHLLRDGICSVLGWYKPARNREAKPVSQTLTPQPNGFSSRELTKAPWDLVPVSWFFGTVINFRLSKIGQMKEKEGTGARSFPGAMLCSLLLVYALAVHKLWWDQTPAITKEQEFLWQDDVQLNTHLFQSTMSPPWELSLSGR